MLNDSRSCDIIIKGMINLKLGGKGACEIGCTYDGI